MNKIIPFLFFKSQFYPFVLANKAILASVSFNDDFSNILLHFSYFFVAIMAIIAIAAIIASIIAKLKEEKKWNINAMDNNIQVIDNEQVLTPEEQRERKVNGFWARIRLQAEADQNFPYENRRPINDDSFPCAAILTPNDYAEATVISHLMRNYYHRKYPTNRLLLNDVDIVFIPNSRAGIYTNVVGPRGQPAKACDLLRAKALYNSPN